MPQSGRSCQRMSEDKIKHRPAATKSNSMSENEKLELSNYEMRCFRQWDRLAVAFQVRAKDRVSGKSYIFSDGKWREAQMGACYGASFLLDESDNAPQVLIDSLWDAGIRPTKGAGSAGAFDAVKYHLEDMRRLVFKPEAKDGDEIKLTNLLHGG